MNLHRIAHLISLAAIVVATNTASAQFGFVPHTSDEGVTLAAEYAAEQLPAGSRLVLIGAVGNAEANGMPLTIEVDRDGTASVWAYVYYVPQRNDWRALSMVHIDGMGASIYDVDPPVPIPEHITEPLDLSGSYATSGAMGARLATDSTFRAFRLRTGERASVVALRPAAALDSALLPPTFPLDAPVWAVTFGTGARPTLMGWVSSRTGDVHVVEPRIAGVDDERTHTSGCVSVAPNPSTGVVLATIASSAEPRVTLYSAAGVSLSTPVRLGSADDRWRAELDLTALPVGTYFLRVECGTWSETVAVRR